MSKQLTVFQQALVDSVLQEYPAISDEQEISIAFSNKFEVWLDGLQKKTQSRVITILKSILIAAIIAALLTGAAMAIPAVREAVIDFFLHEDDVQISITFDPEQAATAPKTIALRYSIAYVPNTFKLTAEGLEKGYAYMWFANTEGERIAYIQCVMPEDYEDGIWWGYDVEESGHRTVLLGDYLVEIIDGDENYKLIWTNNEYLFTLELPYSVNEEEMQKIFASWGPKE